MTDVQVARARELIVEAVAQAIAWANGGDGVVKLYHLEDAEAAVAVLIGTEGGECATCHGEYYSYPGTPNEVDPCPDCDGEGRLSGVAPLRTPCAECDGRGELFADSALVVGVPGGEIAYAPCTACGGHLPDTPGSGVGELAVLAALGAVFQGVDARDGQVWTLPVYVARAVKP